MKKILAGIILLFNHPVFAQQINSTENAFRNKLSKEAVGLSYQKVIYDPAYKTIPYSMGDVPAHTGVCTDVVIRAYRKTGIDLQKNVHEDMLKHFKLYPKIWGRTTTDKNIDHRRVPNLMKYFATYGKSLPLSSSAKDYATGDIVCWEIRSGITHIGIVIAQKSADKKRNLVVHNIGNGQVIEDCLFDFKIIGHYYYQAR